MEEIVSAKWLKDNLNSPDLIILDTSLKSSIDGKHASSDKLTIPGSRFFDLKGVFHDKENSFPNTVPRANYFETECRKLGINNQSKIVVFDKFGIYSSPRVWWLFKVMGHETVAVLNGGLPLWIESGYPTIKEFSDDGSEGDFTAKYNPELVVDFTAIEKNTGQRDFLIVDARSEGRFNGITEEPRVHLQSGHIPNSVNIPYQEVLRDNQFKPKEELNELFSSKCAGEENLVFSCGSGLTACIIMLASLRAYSKSKRVYDGSWTEWAELNELYK